MEDRLWGDPLGPAWRSGQTNGNGSRSAGQVGHDARLDARPDVTSPMHLKQSPAETGARGGPLRRAIRTALDYLPRGNTLDAESFRRRHLLMCWILGLHIPALFAFGVWQGYGVSHSALEIATPSACLVLARLARNRRLAAFFVTAGVGVFSSGALPPSGGTNEAHFHLFILIRLIALYQDWGAFLWNVSFTVLSHGIGGALNPDTMY